MIVLYAVLYLVFSLGTFLLLNNTKSTEFFTRYNGDKLLSLFLCLLPISNIVMFCVWFFNVLPLEKAPVKKRWYW